MLSSDSITAPSNVTSSEDVSEAGDGSVMVYVTSDNTLIIAADGNIKTGAYLKFKNLASVTSIDLTCLDTSEITQMNSMFYYCTSLSSLNLGSFNTSNVTNMSWMFVGCTSLSNLDLSSFDTSKVTSMGRMFYDCSKMQSIKVGSKWVIGSDCTTTDMFTNCGVSSVTYV